jgi:hypothetical protein
MVDSELERNSNHSAHSSLRESIIEHLFVGEILKQLWREHITQVEVLKPQVDDAGYDIVIECRRNLKSATSVLRHIQLKSSFLGSKTANVSLGEKLTQKPNWCLIWVFFNQDTLELGPFFWFSCPVQNPLDITEFNITKHSKGDANGHKAERPGHRDIPKGRFVELKSIGDVIDNLFPNA